MKKITILFFGIIIVGIISSCKVNNAVEKPEANGILYPVLKNGKYGYIDSNGEIKIKPQFDDAQDFK
jgi:hypothetical protein